MKISDNVISLEMDANAFFDRAIKSLERRQYDRALKYFRLVLEKEPDNPMNYCNVAGVLAELGHYQEANDMLRIVIQDINPEMAECYYYMANNAVNMGAFEQAEDHLIEYLRHDPAGEYADDAEEMLYMVAQEMGRLPKQVIAPLPSFREKHEEAEWHMEEGRFLQATELLEELVKEQPDYLPIFHHLGLAYFYTGQLDKAREIVTTILENDPNDLHALCNLALLSQHEGNEQITKQMMDMLKKLVPVQPAAAHKLAMTMGTLGEHQVAYELFSWLLKVDEQPEASLYHHAATAAVHVGKLSTANRYWRRAAWLDPQSEIPKFYLEQVEKWLSDASTISKPTGYHYHLPFEEYMLKINQGATKEKISEGYSKHSLLHYSLMWALTHGYRQTKMQVLSFMRFIKHKEAEALLRDFLRRRSEDDELKQIAFFALRHMDAQPPYEVLYNGQMHTVENTKGQEQMWQDVLASLLQNMDTYENPQLDDAKMLWDFLRQFSEIVIRKVEGMAAAIEYVVAKYYDMALTQAQVAEKYGVSASTVARNAKLISPLLYNYFKQMH
jgi:tetratricopeptide (TPR) repeat protein